MKPLEFLKYNTFSVYGANSILISRDYFNGKQMIAVFEIGDVYNNRTRFKFTQKGFCEALDYAQKKLNPDKPE